MPLCRSDQKKAACSSWRVNSSGNDKTWTQEETTTSVVEKEAGALPTDRYSLSIDEAHVGMPRNVTAKCTANPIPRMVRACRQVQGCRILTMGPNEKSAEQFGTLG